LALSKLLQFGLFQGQERPATSEREWLSMEIEGPPD
jgi:hypothetical protein